jgi:hypothetical protein
MALRRCASGSEDFHPDRCTPFQALIPLGEIAYSIASTFYSIDSNALPGDHLLKVKLEIQEALDAWLRNLPLHLHFDPEVDPTPLLIKSYHSKS